MLGIILASHGSLAEGVKEAGQMIFGQQSNLATCTLMPNEGPDDIRNKIESAIKSFDNQDQVLILADLYGGTPFNQSSALLAGKEDKWAIVAGLNLPMFIEALSSRMDPEMNAHDIAKHLVSETRQNIKAYPEALQKEESPKKEVSDKFAQGQVVGNGKIEYVLCRIDTRLLHGQVATSWTKTTKPNRIIVVSDEVAKDNLRKNMIIEAAPSGVRAHVVPISKIVEVDKDPRFGNTKAMLLFENPESLLKAVKAGLSVKHVNIGSIAHSLGKAVITNAVAMGKDDYEALAELSELGIEFDVRKVPSDSDQKFENIMKKAKNELY
ncbi:MULTISPECIES: PTS sugar transporter subunit IIB [Helcococcus]|uniref:PTS system mannose-specific EIIAB component n=1 Tax=Helcococcus bovis TaxID=3153252 RepID=A0ABW9F706_9FIRM